MQFGRLVLFRGIRDNQQPLLVSAGYLRFATGWFSLTKLAVKSPRTE